MPGSIFLSGLLVAHNEEDMIEEALKSLHFCDEIVVVLDRCTDKTHAISKKYATKIIEGGEDKGFDVEGVRRNTGIAACGGPWILELDADERISQELATEIQQTLVHQKDEGYFLLPVHNYIGKRHVKYGWAGSFGTNSVARLFSKGAKVWGDGLVHPKVELENKLGRLTQPIIHFVDKDINDMIDRLKRYTDARAKDMAQEESLPKFRTTVRKGLTRFYKSYFARKGYKEGRMGFLLALMAMLFVILSHIKAELEIKKT
jgi:glycosyltransferase involved in cell wall biosynthesis